MIPNGDTEKQALLRDEMIKKKKIEKSRYASKILSFLKPTMKLLDIGCGTAHIIRKLAANRKASEHVGLDVSNAMLELAKKNCERFRNIEIVAGDGLILPFPEQTFDIVITRLAEYSSEEVYQTLKKGGIFFEYGLGPHADREVFEFFPKRIETKNFFFPDNLNEWKQEVIEPLEKNGLVVLEVQDYKENNYYKNEDELMDLIEMVPLVKNFDRKKDRILVNRLAEKYRDGKRIRITWHYYILVATRP